MSQKLKKKNQGILPGNNNPNPKTFPNSLMDFSNVIQVLCKAGGLWHVLLVPATQEVKEGCSGLAFQEQPRQYS